MHRILFRGLLLVWLLAWVAPSSAQSRAEILPIPPRDLQQITRSAGIIIGGKVVSVEPIRSVGAQHVASVQITLQVEQGIRGARSGQTVSFREWAGLWSTGARYRVGQRVLLFLYSPSALGLTSPVGGTAGRFAIDHSGQIVFSEAQWRAIRGSTTPIRSDSTHRVPLQEFVHAVRRMERE